MTVAAAAKSTPPTGTLGRGRPSAIMPSRTSIHESAHVCVGEAVGVVAVGFSLEPRWNSGGRMFHVERIDSEADAVASMTMAMAGMAAERRLWDDEQVEPHGAQDRTDAHRLAAKITGLRGTTAERLDLIEQATRRADELVTLHWSAIVELARLMDHVHAEYIRIRPCPHLDPERTIAPRPLLSC